MKFEVKIEVVLIVILLTSAVRELDCREQADNFFDTKGLSRPHLMRGKSMSATNQLSTIGRQAESMTALSTMANGFVHFVVNFLNAVYNVVNSKTTFNALNTFTSAYSNLFNSDGWSAIDTSINTLGNTFNVYDALLERFRNFAKISKPNVDDVDHGDNRELEQLQSSLDSVNDQLISVKELLKEITCRYETLTKTDGRRRSANNKDCSIFRDKVRNIALLKDYSTPISNLNVPPKVYKI